MIAHAIYVWTKGLNLFPRVSLLDPGNKAGKA